MPEPDPVVEAPDAHIRDSISPSYLTELVEKLKTYCDKARAASSASEKMEGGSERVKEEAKCRHNYEAAEEVLERLGRPRITDWITIEAMKESKTSKTLIEIKKEFRKSKVSEGRAVGDACKALLSTWQFACGANKDKPHR